jgi:hypothetical protein
MEIIFMGIASEKFADLKNYMNWMETFVELSEKDGEKIGLIERRIGARRMNFHRYGMEMAMEA